MVAQVRWLARGGHSEENFFSSGESFPLKGGDELAVGHANLNAGRTGVGKGEGSLGIMTRISSPLARASLQRAAMNLPWVMLI